MKTLKKEQSELLTLSEHDVFAARFFVASALAGALRDPKQRRSGAAPVDMDLLVQAWHVMAEQMPALNKSKLSLGELIPDSVDPRDLIRWLELDADTTEEVYCGVFGLLTSSKDCPPYETEYSHWTDPTYRASQMADIAGFYRAFGMEADPNRPDRVDHVAFEIDFISNILLRLAGLTEGLSPEEYESDERVVVSRAALRSFMKDHASWWMPTFGGCIERRIGKVLDSRDTNSALSERPWRLFESVAKLLRAWVAMERVTAGIEPVRQIISPRIAVEPLPGDGSDECGASACGSCAVTSPSSPQSAP